MKVRAYLSIGFAGADREEILDLPDGLTEEQIEEEVRDWMSNYLDWSYARVDDSHATSEGGVS